MLVFIGFVSIFYMYRRLEKGDLLFPPQTGSRRLINKGFLGAGFRTIDPRKGTETVYPSTLKIFIPQCLEP